MSDGRRRRYRRGRDDKDKDKKQTQTPVIVLAKRENNDNGQTSVDAKPKILLKSKSEKDNEPTSSNDSVLKTIIVNRSEFAQSPALSATTSPNITLQRETQQNSSGNVENIIQNVGNVQIIEPVPKMTRSTTIISLIGAATGNGKKMLMKQNTEFLVVGVVGTQGVGKSTILNLLACEDIDNDYYEKLFINDEGMFRTRNKTNKWPPRANTESIQMFINSDRVILLDTPPVFTNPYKKDMTSSELDDLHLIIGLYSVCHLLIVVEDEYLNLNFMRLLRFAELLKPPTQEDKQIVSSYLPNLLFVRNRVGALDLNAEEIEEYNSLKLACFDDSELNIYLGKTTQAPAQTTVTTSPQHNVSNSEQIPVKQKRTRTNENEKPIVNSFFVPKIEDGTEYSQMALKEAIKNLRRLVFMSPRNQMYNGTQDFTELMWFEMLTQVWRNRQYFFLNTYEDMHRQVYEVRRQCDVTVTGSGSGGVVVSSAGNNNNGNNHTSFGKDLFQCNFHN